MKTEEPRPPSTVMTTFTGQTLSLMKDGCGGGGVWEIFVFVPMND